MLAKEFGALFGGNFAPALALARNFAHADCDLRRAEIANGDGGQDGFTNHCCAPRANVRFGTIGISAGAKSRFQSGFPSTTERMAISRGSANIATCTGWDGRQQSSALFLRPFCWRQTCKACALRIMLQARAKRLPRNARARHIAS